MTFEQELFSPRLAPYPQFEFDEPRRETSVISIINELESSKIRLAMVMSIVKDTLWEYDVKKKRFYHLRQRLASNELDISDEGIPLKDWTRRIHPDDFQKVRMKWRDALCRGETFRVSYRERFEDDRWHWMLSAIQCLGKDNQGHVVRVMGIHMDVTSLVQSRQLGQRTENRLKTIFENAGIGIALTTRQGRLTQINPAMLKTSGYSQSEMLGTSIVDYAHPEDAGKVLRLLENMRLGSDREYLNEVRFFEKDGDITWLSITATPTHDDPNQIDSVILLFENVTESHKLKERLRFEAQHDLLTGVYNRRALLAHLDSSVDLAERYNRHLHFCMVDIDHFKKVNDVHGHQIGDRVLSRFARVAHEEIRKSDVIGRYGGEEFGLILPETSTDGILALLERVQRKLAKTNFKGKDGKPFQVTATFGVAILGNGDGAAELIAKADQALYDGKQAGRNKIIAYAVK